jgi:GT2 family glycosyltransferase
MLSFPDGRLQHTTHRFPSLRLAAFEDLGMYKLMPWIAPGALLRGYWDHASERDVDWVIGAFMLLPREVFEQTGGFDERLFMYGEDMEWCHRIRARGWRVRFYPSASIMHWGHASADIRWGDERIALCLERDRDFYREHHGRVLTMLFMGIHVLGAALRTLYYSARAKLGGAQAAPYRAMQPAVASTLRILVSLAAGRR